MDRLGAKTEHGPIAIFRKNGETLEPDMKAIEKVFLHPRLEKRRVCIVSIVGALRGGKSFMLNLFLRFLQHGGYKCQNDDWLRNGGDTIDGFNWDAGRKLCTTGIFVWSEIFFVVQDGEEIGIILMDTEGLCYNGEYNAMIFAMSTLISSVQILNVSYQIQESDLAELKSFSEYGRMAHEQSPDNVDKPFQRLIFLVRDWVEVEHECGLAGGHAYIKRIFERHINNTDHRLVRKNILKGFSSIECCLFPFPGRRVATRKSTFPDIDEDFRVEIDPFVRHILSPSNLEIKKLDGLSVTGFALYHFIQGLCGVSYKGVLPSPANLVKMQSEARDIQIEKYCSDTYAEKMGEAIRQDGCIAEPANLQAKHDEAIAFLLTKFDALTNYTAGESTSHHSEALQLDIDREFEYVKEQNEEKKLEREATLLKILEDEKDSYITNLKQQLQDNVLEEQPLMQYHTTQKKSALTSFQRRANTGRDQSYTEMYCSRLDVAIEHTFHYICKDNTEKLLSATEKARDDTREERKSKRQILQLTTEWKSDYKEKMDKYTTEYVLERMLLLQHKRVKEQCCNKFKSALYDQPISDVEAEKEHVAFLHKLDEEYEIYKEWNQLKKDILGKVLEQRRASMLVKYTTHFASIMKSRKYIEERDLMMESESLQEKLIQESMEEIDSAQLPDPMFSDHVKAARAVLSEKQEGVRMWNKRNRGLTTRLIGK